MKAKIIKALAILLCLSCLMTTVLASDPADAESTTAAAAAQQAEEAFCALAGCEKGTLLTQEGWVKAGEPTCDWLAYVFAINGVQEKYDIYLDELERYVTESYAERGKLPVELATEYHRTAMTVLALGGDPAAFGKNADGSPVNLVADGIWNYAPGIGNQGSNGLVYALILLDAKGYEIPEGAGIGKEGIREELLDSRNEDGGFGFMPGSSNVDVTAMALTALAPYKDLYGEQIEEALSYLSLQQEETGGYVSFGENTCESAAQVIIALCSLGIDPDTDARFIKNGTTLPDVLDSFRLPDGTYCHVRGEIWDIMATEQALLARTALERMREGKSGIYDFRDYKPAVSERPQAGQGQSRQGIIIGAAAAAVVVVIVIIIVLRRRNRHAADHE